MRVEEVLEHVNVPSYHIDVSGVFLESSRPYQHGGYAVHP